MKRSLVVFAMLAVAAKGGNPDADVIAAAKAEIGHHLRDPQSAQFRDVHVIAGALNGRRVCGQVNAKNGYGGYGGFSRFAYESSFKDVRFSTGDDLMFEAYSEGCWPSAM
jgi:hypothetical protein